MDDNLTEVALTEAVMIARLHNTIDRLRKDGEAFRVAVIESGALNSVSQDKYINQLRAFEGALALCR